MYVGGKWGKSAKVGESGRIGGGVRKSEELESVQRKHNKVFDTLKYSLLFKRSGDAKPIASGYNIAHFESIRPQRPTSIAAHRTNAY